MKVNLVLLSLLTAGALAAAAATPPPEKLLPADTLIMFSIPDLDRARAGAQETAAAQLWRDPALKPFVNKFTAKWKTDVLTPLERELGVKLADYTGLAHGQFTFAVTQNGWTGQKDADPGVLLLLDSKDQAAQLTRLLADLKRKWTDSGKQLRAEKIRDVEFLTLLNAGEEITKALEKAFPGRPAAPGGDGVKKGKSTLTIGQAGPLLLLGNQVPALEQVLVRLSGGQAPALAEVPAYEANHSALFRDATAYGWVNCKPILEAVKKQLGQAGAAGAENPLGVKPEKAFDALGLNGLQTAAFQLRQSREGTDAAFFIGAPENGRKGLFKMLVPDPKESSPPPFVAANATKFARVRLDLPRFWTTLEAMLTELSPQVGALVQMSLANAGKDKDPNFDLKKQLIGNLGNDLITYQKAPRSAKLADLGSPPTLFLLASPNADQVLNSLKVALAMINPVPLKEREFLGRKIHSLAAPPAPGPDGQPVERSFSLATSGGYLAMSADPGILEEYLRSAGNQGKPLADVPGLKEAAQRVGGLGTGWFGYEHQGEVVRVILNAVKQDPNYLDKLLAGALANPLAGAALAGPLKGLKEWFDFATLPPYDQIAKFFHFTVQTGSANAEGITFKAFSPTPPALRQ